MVASNCLPTTEVIRKGDIARLTCLLSYSPDGSTRREVGPVGCIWYPILWEGEVIGGQSVSQSVSNGISRQSDGGFLL